MPATITWSWILFLGWWLYRAAGGKATRSRESIASRAAHAVAATAAYLLIWSPWGGRLLDTPLMSESARTSLIPAFSLLTLLGIGFAIWAREHLGRNWSARITIKEGHELIRTGPYSAVRHPIYTGILTAALATALAAGRVGALIGFAILLAGFWLKSAKEERWMGREFGEQYDHYRQASGHFLPRIAGRRKAGGAW